MKKTAKDVPVPERPGLEMIREDYHPIRCLFKDNELGAKVENVILMLTVFAFGFLAGYIGRIVL